MMIEETFLSKEFTIDTPNPYETATKIEDFMLERGEIIEKKNTYETDGLINKVDIVYDFIEQIDNFSCVIASVNLSGEKSEDSASGFLTIKTTFTLQIKVKEYGMASQLFSEYYVNSFFSKMKKVAEERTEKIVKALDTEVKHLQKI